MEHSSQTPGNRTFMCAVVFIDIIEYSKKPVARQLVIKNRFNEIVAKGLESVANSDRIILDTGDGAALCFLGDPEDALFVTNSIRNDFAAESEVPELTVRIGINLGPVKMMRDLNGNSNIVGDGINVAQRVMSFAQSNQILVSRSYFEVVSRLTQEYSQLFRFVGAREDKHVREHELYEVSVSGSGHDSRPNENKAADTTPSRPEPQPAPKPVPPPVPQPKRMSTALIVGITVAACIAVLITSGLIMGDDDTDADALNNNAADQRALALVDAESKKTPVIPVAPAVRAPTSGQAPKTPGSGVFVNEREFSLNELQQHQNLYGTVVQRGRYWYDATSGLYGFWGREPIGYIRTGHPYGRAPENASNGNTGIFLNGRQINDLEAAQWQIIFRQAINPGRYWLDGNTGNVGVEGNPNVTGNVLAAIHAARGY